MLDQHGQAFRYSAEKTGPRGARVLERVRPGEQRFDIVAVAEALGEAGTMVLYGVSGVLDDYSDYQARDDGRRRVVGRSDPVDNV